MIWWRKLLPGSVMNFLANIWLGSLIAFVGLFFVSVAIAIFGWPLTAFFDADTTLNYLNTLSYLMLITMFLSVPTGFAHEIQRQVEMGKT
jgi:hypothetical protein